VYAGFGWYRRGEVSSMSSLHTGKNLRPEDCTTIFSGEGVSPGRRDPQYADIDQPAASPDLLARYGRKSAADKPGDHADAKSVCHEPCLRGTIEAGAREQGQRASLLGSQAYRHIPGRLSPPPHCVLTPLFRSSGTAATMKRLRALEHSRASVFDFTPQIRTFVHYADTVIDSWETA
jgi:hypothetical protein